MSPRVNGSAASNTALAVEPPISDPGTRTTSPSQREPNVRRSKPTGIWAAEHITALREFCSNGLSDQEIQKGLQERFQREWSIRAIRTKRFRLRLVGQGSQLARILSQRHRKYWPTEEIDGILKECFAGKYTGRGAIRTAQQRTKWPPQAIVRRARELGLSHPRDTARWSPDEEALLEKIAYQSPRTVQRQLERRLGIHRTLTAIEAKRQRMRLPKNLDGMNLNELAEALGVGNKTIWKWLETGKIRGLLRFPELQSVNRHVWFFPNREIRHFITAHLELIDLARVEKWWFVDMLLQPGARKAE
jgi:transposase